MADGAEFSIDFDVKGGGDALSAADALAALASKLELAGAAATATSDAMKIGQAAYDQSEAAANKAALAVEKIGLAAQAQKSKLEALAAGSDGVVNVAAYQRAAAKLEELNARQSEAAAKSASAMAAMNAEASALDKLKAAAATAADKESALSKAHDDLKKKGDDAAGAAKAQADAETKSVGAAGLLEGAFAKLGGPLGAVGQKAAGVTGAVLKMGKSLGAAGPYVAAAVLAIAIAAAFVGATLAITKFAVESADTARTQALLSDGIAGSVKGGRALDETLDRLGKTVPQSRDELLGMAGDLAKTGLKGEALSTALEDAAVKAAKLKWGPDFAKQMLSLPNQAARLKSNLAGVFSGLNIEGLLEGLSTLVALFDKNTATGQALKVVFESLFQPVVDGLSGLIPKAVATFIQLEILGMKAAIAIKPYRQYLIDIGIGFGILAAIVVAIVVVFVAAGLAMVAAFALLMALPFLLKDAFNSLAGGIKSGIGAAVDWLTGKFEAVMAFFQGLSLAEIGTALIDGLISGITGGGAGVLKAITGIATGAIGAAKGALGIASPSKVFAEIGMHTAAGMEQGVDGGTAGVQASVEALVEPPAAANDNGSAPGAAAAGSSGGGTVYNIYLTPPAGADPGAYLDEFRNWLDGLGAQAGTAVPNG